MRVLITGGSGLVGQGIKSICEHYNYQFIFSNSKDCNLLDLKNCQIYFKKILPDIVIHLAANVGGLYKNLKYKVDMLEKNILINQNVLKCCHQFKVKKCISCLSTCIFPDKTTYPINEDMLHNGAPHESNYPYAYAKRLLEITSRAYNDNYPNGCKFICVIPTNIYGEHDNFSLEDGHVIPSLIHRCYLAKKDNKSSVIKGTGKPLRQFIYSKDLAKLILWVMENYNDNCPIILSTSENDERSIRNIGWIIAKIFEYDNIIFDNSFSDGQYKKSADNSKLMNLLENFKFTPIEIGIKNSIEWFIQNYNKLRK